MINLGLKPNKRGRQFAGTLMSLASLALVSGCSSGIDSNVTGLDGRNGSVVLASTVTSISGSAAPFLGLIAQRQDPNLFDLLMFPSAYAAACGDVYAYIYSVDSSGDVSENALATIQLTTNDAAFTFDNPSGVDLSGTTVDYILEVSGCNMITRRPLTNPSSQEITWRSSLISYIVNTNQPDKMSDADRGDVADYMAAVSGATMQAVYSNITGSVTLTNRFQTVFGFAISDLQDAHPKRMEITAPTSINEGVPANYSASFSHWNAAYTSAFLWKLDGADVSTTQNYAYTPGPNDQGTHTVELFVGKDDGAGNVDLTKPHFNKAYTVTVNNTQLPTAPSMAMISPASTTTSAANITIGINTGALGALTYAGCDSFTSDTTSARMAITINDATVPAPANFTLPCNAGPTLSRNLTLTTAGTNTIRLWVRDSAGVVSATPSTLTVTYSPPTQLAFTTQPSAAGTICTTLAQQPVVAVRDPLNNTVTSSAAAITLAAYSDATCATPAAGVTVQAATNPRTAVSGVATFTSVQLVSTVGATTVYLRASATGLTSACSNAVVLGAGTTTLAWQTAPSSSALISTNLSVQPVVKYADACNNTVTTVSTNISLGAFTNAACTVAAGGTLAVTTNPVTPTAGVATFAGVNYNAAANIYIGAQAAGYTTLCRALSISAGGAHQLAFTTAPSDSGTAGTNLTTQPRVSIQDAGGNNVGAGINSITLATYSDSSCSSAIASGLAATTNPLAATAGHAQFAGVRMTTAGTYYLRASTAGLQSACYGPITIGPAAASTLAYSTQPSNTASAGNDLATQPVVDVRDAYGNRISTATNTVTLAAYTNAACTTAATGTFAVTGGNPVDAVSGQAAFGGISYTKAETIYIRASAAGLTSACSNAIAVSAGAATKLAFSQSPGNGWVCSPWSTQPIVQIRDTYDNLVTTATDSVTIEIHSNNTCTSQVAAPATWTNAAANSNPRNAVAGVASWVGTSSYARRPGGGLIYLKATAAGLTSACSAVINANATVIAGLAFTTQPSATATAGQTLAQQPSVEIREACGDRITAASNQISIGMSDDASCVSTDYGTLTVTTNPVSASSGVSTFAGVTYNRSGTKYLKAWLTATPATKTCSNAIAISSNTSSRLTFLTYPKDAMTNMKFAPAPSVAVTDSYGNVVSAASSSITLAAYSDSTCTIAAAGTLSVTTNPVASTNGISAFSGVKYSQEGRIWLKATGTGGFTETCVGPVDVTNVGQLAMGTGGGCYRKATGGVYCWGTQYVGGATTEQAVPMRQKNQTAQAVDVAMGNNHQCIVLSNGELRCWGNNSYAQLGDGIAGAKAIPSLVTGGFTDWVQSSLSTEDTTCALRANGTIWCWGRNAYGEAGSGTTGVVNTPTQVTGITNAVYVALGYRHACAILRDSTVMCWGRGVNGQLGNGAAADSTTPVAVLGIRNAVKIAVNQTSTYVVTSDGTLYCWGGDTGGECGSSATSAGVNSTPLLADLTDVKDIAASNRYFLAVTNTGAVYSSGMADQGQTGQGANGNTLVPTQIAEVVDPVSIAAGFYSAGAMLKDGSILNWGRSYQGSLGDGDLAIYSHPTRAPLIESLGTIAKIRGTKSGTYPHNGCLVLSDGSLYCMGLNNSCQVGTGSSAPSVITSPIAVTAFPSVFDVAPGDYTSCVILNDRTVRCWGRNTEGQLGVNTGGVTTCSPQNPGVANVISIDIGEYTVCAHIDDGGNTSDGLGSISCWGEDTEGSLGDGLPLANSPAPVTVSGITAAKALTVGHDHACAIIDAGAAGAAGDTVKCWGDDLYGSLGDDAAFADASSPVDVSGLTDVAEIAAGGFSTCARKTDGTVWCWGLNTSGQLGNNSLVNSGVPVQAIGITTATQLVGNNRSFCARLADNTMQCWGQGTYGTTGTGQLTGNTDRTPQPVLNLTDVSLVGTSGVGNIAVKSDGTVWSWGWKYYGNIAAKNNTHILRPAARVVVPPTSGSGDGFSCRIERTGTVKCWGKNNYGQLGNGSNIDSSSPVTVTGITTAESISVGADHACVVLYDGGVRCWGRNSDGQLGNNTTTDSNTPVTIGLIGNVVQQVAAGRAHTCAFLEGSTFNVRCWGDNAYGQLGDATNIDRLQPAVTSVTGPGGLALSQTFQKIFAGADHTCAVMRGGSVRCWGRNDYNQLGDGTTTNQNRAVLVLNTENVLDGFSGPLAHHSCAISSDGDARIFCWGDNVSGTLGNGGTAASSTALLLMNGASAYTEATSLGAGASHTCATFRDGTARCWGNNGSGRLGDGTTNNTTSPVAVTGLTAGSTITLGSDHTCACTTSGAVKCWGENQYGQLGNASTTDSSSPVDVSF